MAAHSLSIFFPCHNEEANVERVARAALTVAASLAGDFEVIIVDDGSRDRTAELAEGLRREDPEHIRIVRHETNRGYGAALASGFRAATKELVFYTDGDGQFDLGELPRLLPLIERYDIVSAFRVNREDPFFRHVNAACWGALVNFLFRMRVRDVDCAFKLYRREMFDRMELESTGALIDTEILAKALRLGYTITQIGVRHYPRLAGRQTGANLRVILRAFRELFRLHRRIRETMPRERGVPKT